MSTVEEREAAHIPDHELLRIIGRGSYGEVWQARNVMGTPRAVKIVRRQDFEHTRPFDREFEGIQQYEPISRSHEGLVQVLHVGMERRKNYFYYVMELADNGQETARRAGVKTKTGSGAGAKTGTGTAAGGAGKNDADLEAYQPRTLRDELFYRGALPVEECIEIGIALAGALGHLHRHGLVHRDVKPSNIIFVNNRAKLADVGLVALMSDTRSMVGTEGFVAPEGTGQPRSDIYSLGRVLYECVTGLDRLKFPDVPENWVGSSEGKKAFEFMEIVLRAAESEPKRRYSTTEEMLADLALLQAGKSVRHIRRVEQRLKRLMRVVVFAAAGLALAGGAWFYERTRLERVSRTELAARQAEMEALRSKRRVQELLRDSLLAEAQSVRLSGQAGAREKALAAVERARVIGGAPAERMRTEAASALGILDAGEFGPTWPPDAVQGTVTVVSRDAAFVATCAPDGRTRVLRRARRGMEAEGEFFLPSRAVRGMKLSRGGRYLAVEYHDLGLEMRDARTGETLWRKEADGVPPEMDFSRDGEWLIVSTMEGLEARRTKDGESVLLAPGLPSTRQVLLAPDGTWAVAAVTSEKGFRVFSQLPGTMPGPDDAAGIKHSVIESDIEVVGASISGDSRYLAAAVSEDRLRVWEFPSLLQVAWARGHQRTVRSTAFHPEDSSIVASTGWDGTTRLWDIPTKQELLVIPAGGEEVVIAPDRGEILLESWNGTTFRVASFSPRRGMRVMMLPPLAPMGLFCGLRFSPDGRLLAAAGDAGLVVWNMADGIPLHLAQGTKNFWRNVRFTPDGSTLWASSWTGLWRYPISWDAAGKPVIGPGEKWAEGPFRHLASAGDLMVAGTQMADGEGKYPILVTRSEEESRVIRAPWLPDSLSCSPDGRWLAASRYPHAGGMLWDLRNPDAPGIFIDAPSRCMFSFFPHLPVLAVASDRNFRFQPLPGAADLPPLPELKRTSSEEVPGRIISSDDGSLLAATTGPAEVSLFNGRTFEKLATLDSPFTPFDSVLTFSPDGKQLALAGGVSRVVVWDIAWLKEELSRRKLGWD